MYKYLEKIQEEKIFIYLKVIIFIKILLIFIVGHKDFLNKQIH